MNEQWCAFRHRIIRHIQGIRSDISQDHRTAIAPLRFCGQHHDVVQKLSN